VLADASHQGVTLGSSGTGQPGFKLGYVARGSL
jgi:hypothetical protein